MPRRASIVELFSEEAEGVWKNPDWPEGVFSTRKDFNLETDEECIAAVTGRIHEWVPAASCPELCFVSGFFADSLTDELGESLRNTVSYCHVDCDLYISTLQCMDWSLRHQIFKRGCVVRFDDWLTNGQWAGNNKAFGELTNKYGVIWEHFSSNVFRFVLAKP